MRPGTGSIVTVGVLLLVLASAGLAGAQVEPSFSQETRYVVPSEDLETATVFQRFFSEVAGSDVTVRLPTPWTPGFQSVANDTGVLLDWVPAADGSLDVAVPSGTQWVYVTSRLVPIADGRLLFVGSSDVVSGRTFVALPVGVAVGGTAFSAAEAATLDARWPLPADHRLVASDWTGPGVPATLAFAAVVEADGTPVALVSALAVLLVVATLWALHRVHKGISAPTARVTMPIMEHLTELRRRVLWVLGTLVGGAAFFFAFGFRTVLLQGLRVPYPFPSIYNNAAAQTFSFLSERVVAPGVEVIVTNPFDAVLTQMGLAIGLAVLVTFPVLFYHVYAFLAPGLKPSERRVVLVAVPFVVVLFLLGGAFGLLFMMPFTIGVLYSFAGTLSATAFLNVHDLVALAAMMAVVFGVAFQLPLVMGLTARLGLVSASTYLSKWRHALLVIVIIAAVVTDPTVVTQLIVAGVMVVLYGVGLLLAFAVERRAEGAGPSEPGQAND